MERSFRTTASLFLQFILGFRAAGILGCGKRRGSDDPTSYFSTDPGRAVSKIQRNLEQSQFPDYEDIAFAIGFSRNYFQKIF